MGKKGRNEERRDEIKKIGNILKKQILLMRALFSTNRYYCYPEVIISCPLSNRKSSELVTDPCTENLEPGPTKGWLGR